MAQKKDEANPKTRPDSSVIEEPSTTDKPVRKDITDQKEKNDFPIVGIGASAGGLDALLRDKSGNQVAVVSITREITQRKLMEEEILRKEVEMVATREADRLKTQLLSTVSHELRTPLASIKGYATMLRDFDKRLKLAQRRQCLELIDQATDRLMELIGQLLDISRLGAGLFRLSKAPTKIDELIDRAVVEAQLRSPEHRFRTELKERLPKLSVDSKRIHQVLDNLLENTIRYSEKGTEVIVRGETKPDVVEITVADQGRGIPASEIDKVFDRMYRLEQRLSQDPSGLGLGLPLCKGLVEAHNGRIWIDSRKGKGTTVHFTLPLATKQKVANVQKTQ